MADFSDLVDQLKQNNRSEAGRDSIHTREMRIQNKTLQEISGKQDSVVETNVNVPTTIAPTASEQEESRDEQKNDNKRNTLLEKLVGVSKSTFGAIKDSTSAIRGKIGGGIMSLLKGTLFAGLLIAAFAFLNSPLFDSMIGFIDKTILPALDNFLNNTLKPFGENLLKFFKDPSFDNFTGLFSGVENPASIAFALVGVVALLKPSLLLKGLILGVKALKGALSLAGAGISAAAKGIGGSRGTPVPEMGGGQSRGGPKGGPRGAPGGKIGGVLRGLIPVLGALSTAALKAAPGLIVISATLLAIAAAIRIASPAIEPFSKVIKELGGAVRETFSGLSEFISSAGDTIVNITKQIGDSIGNVIDRITKMETAGTEAATKQIKDLSDIPSNNLIETAKGVDLLKKALDDFGGGTFTKVIGGLFGSGPIGKIIELTEKVPQLVKAAEAIKILSTAGSDFALAKEEIGRREEIAQLESQLARRKQIVGKRSSRSAKERLAQDEAKLAELRRQSEAFGKSRVVEEPIKKRQMGGPVERGEDYLVGETGPEIFVPSNTGLVISAQRTAQLAEAAMQRRLDMTGGGDAGSAPIINTTNTVATSNSSNTTVSSTSLTPPNLILKTANASV